MLVLSVLFNFAAGSTFNSFSTSSIPSLKSSSLITPFGSTTFQDLSFLTSSKTLPRSTQAASETPASTTVEPLWTSTSSEVPTSLVKRTKIFLTASKSPLPSPTPAKIWTGFYISRSENCMDDPEELYWSSSEGASICTNPSTSCDYANSTGNYYATTCLSASLPPLSRNTTAPALIYTEYKGDGMKCFEDNITWIWYSKLSDECRKESDSRSYRRTVSSNGRVTITTFESDSCDKTKSSYQSTIALWMQGNCTQKPIDSTFFKYSVVNVPEQASNDPKSTPIFPRSTWNLTVSQQIPITSGNSYLYSLVLCVLTTLVILF